MRTIYSKIKRKILKMDVADKFELFLGFCSITFLVLLLLKLIFISSISWWFIFIPVIIPLLLIMKEAGAFNN